MQMMLVVSMAMLGRAWWNLMLKKNAQVHGRGDGEGGR
jgi:hypothetical protein